MIAQLHTTEELKRWSGPESYGISFSHLSRFLECPERCYLYSWECIEEDEGYDFAREYGSLFHGAEEYARNGADFRKGVDAEADKLHARYPAERKAILEAASWAKVQYPEYARFWKADPHSRRRNEVFAERGYKVPYRLPSGRVVYLRGIIDGGFTETVRRKLYFYVQENKTKGRIDEQGITQAIAADLQSMLYVIAATKLRGVPPVSGLLYNVVRRPLSERWAPRQKKSESFAQFQARYAKEYLRKDPEKYFMRWKVELTKKDIEAFRRTILDPILERLCTWWDWIVEAETTGKDRFSHPAGIHWQAPWGVYNSLASGWRGSFFEYLTSGRKRTSGLTVREWGDGKYAPGAKKTAKKRPPKAKRKK